MDMQYIWPEDPFVLDDFQNEAVNFTAQHGRVFIPLPVGAGKTLIPLKASRSMEVKSITVLCLGNSLWTWVRQMKQWRPDLAERMIVMENMTAATREKVWNDPYWRVIIAKVGTFVRDYEKIKSVPTMVIGDECQKYLRKHKSQTSNKVVEYFDACRFAVLLTGTGISKGRQEFFPALQALRLKRFSSYWRFVNNFCYTHRGHFGTEILGPRNTPQFRDTTRDTILRPSFPIKLPEVVRQRLPVEMTGPQTKMYRSLKEEMYVYLESGDLLATSNSLALTTRLRQILCCPKILDPLTPTYGAGIENALDHMEEDEERKHCVWFTPFTDAIPYMQEALRAQGYLSQVIFRHGMDMNELREAEDKFRGNPECVAVCSILFSQSFELETGNPAYFIGYSFNPDDNEQAEGRLRRKTTKRDFVNAYYIENLNTYDERNLAILGRKHLNTRVDMHDMHAIRELIR